MGADGQGRLRNVDAHGIVAATGTARRSVIDDATVNHQHAAQGR